MTLAQDAARWMVLIDARLANTSEIIRWSDEQIVAADKPHPALIELSTTPPDQIAEILSLLRLLASNIDKFEALRCAAGSILAAIKGGKLPAERAATFTYCHLCGHCFDLPPDLEPLYSADDSFELAISEQYGNRNDVERDFLQALENVARR
jgi:hypothetical protein